MPDGRRPHPDTTTDHLHVPTDADVPVRRRPTTGTVTAEPPAPHRTPTRVLRRRAEATSCATFRFH